MNDFMSGACTVTGGLEIVKGTLDDLRLLERYHYRDKLTSPYVAIYTMRDRNTRHGFGVFAPVAGVIVYTNPTLNCQMRDVATGGIFLGLSRRQRLEAINAKFRTISRVIIDPRYRGLSLASKLAAATMPMIGTDFVESQAVMGHVTQFFERAGMRPFYGKRPERVARLAEALGIVGISEEMFVEPTCVHEKIGQLERQEREFIERHFGDFLGLCKKWRNEPHSIKRTRKVLRAMTPRPVYYFWSKYENTNTYDQIDRTSPVGGAS